MVFLNQIIKINLNCGELVFFVSLFHKILLRELGIGIVAYSPLGRGFFGGKAVLESLNSESLLVSFES